MFNIKFCTRNKHLPNIVAPSIVLAVSAVDVSSNRHYFTKHSFTLTKTDRLIRLIRERFIFEIVETLASRCNKYGARKLHGTSIFASRSESCRDRMSSLSRSFALATEVKADSMLLSKTYSLAFKPRDYKFNFAAFAQ